MRQKDEFDYSLNSSYHRIEFIYRLLMFELWVETDHFPEVHFSPLFWMCNCERATAVALLHCLLKQDISVTWLCQNQWILPSVLPLLYCLAKPILSTTTSLLSSSPRQILYQVYLKSKNFFKPLLKKQFTNDPTAAGNHNDTMMVGPSANKVCVCPSPLILPKLKLPSFQES